MSTRHITAVTASLALYLGNALYASADNSPDAEPIPPTAWAARVFALADSEVEGTDASYAISSVALELQYCHWAFGLERQYFAWDEAAAFPENATGADPWEFLNRVGLGFAHSHVHTDRWMSEVMAGVSLGFEDEIDDSLTAGFGGYGAYRITPELLLLMGLYYSRHQKIETDFDLIPILGAVIHPDATQGWSAQVGLPTTKACWHFDERTQLALELSTLENGVTRLSNDNPVRPRGYAEFSNAAITLMFSKRFDNDLELSAGIGHSLQRELKLYDETGDNERTVDIERGTSIEFAIRKSL